MKSEPTLQRLRARGFRWCYSSELDGDVVGPDGLRLGEWVQSGQARIIKHGPHRVVYRVDLPQLSFYLKHNLIPDRLTWLRSLVRRSKARREFESALSVRARGVPTIDPLALGEEERPLGTGESFLITRSLENAQPLNIFMAVTMPGLPPARCVRLRQRLAKELGRLVARIHEAGVLHNDLHAANLLVRVGPGDTIELYVIDLNSVHVGRPLDWPTSRGNLVVLNSWFVPRVSRPDRLRFWKAYFETRRFGAWQLGPLGPRLNGSLALEIEKQTWQFNLRFWSRRDRRCLRNNRYYRVVHAPGVRGYSSTDLDVDVLKSILANPDLPLQQPGVKLLKDSISSTVAELEMVVNGRPCPVIYKRFRVTSWTDPLASLLRKPPALRSWIQGQGFRERGLPTARPLAVFHRTRSGMLYEGYLITAKIENALELRDYVQQIQELPLARRLAVLRRQIANVARTIRHMHRRRLSHRDLKAANVLARRWDAPPPPLTPSDPRDACNLLHMPEGSVWLIDLVGVELFRKLPRARRIQNLARLNASFFGNPLVTRTDRLRFLRVYLNWAILGRGAWKVWWRQIDKATRHKVNRNRRRNRPLW